MSEEHSAVDWAGWYDRWEAQQQGYMPDREARFGVVCEIVAAVCGENPHVVDLGCGPGSLAQRVLRQVPGSRVTAVDMDPVLLAIGRNALGDCDGRLRFVDADLRGGWEGSLSGPLDAAVSTTALHWLQADALASLYGRLAGAVRAGGVFVNGDSLSFAADQPQIAAACRAVRDLRRTRAPAPSGEDWDAWWAAVEGEVGLASEVAERARRHHDHPEHDHSADLVFHRRALQDAGFAEVDTVWQHLADRVLVAIR